MAKSKQVSPETTHEANGDGTQFEPRLKPKENSLPVEFSDQEIVNLAIDRNWTVFVDQYQDGFASIPTSDRVRETVPIRSTKFKSHLCGLVERAGSSTPSLSELKKAVGILELKALRSNQIELFTRTKAEGNRLLIDMGDTDWNMIEVVPGHWEVKPQTAPNFVRARHLKSLPNPERGGNVWELFDHVPIDTSGPQDVGDKLLLLTWVLAAMHPSIPSPILLWVGQQGSAKTTRSKRLRSLIDPSETPVLGELEMKSIFQTFHHHAVPSFENVSRFNRTTSDIFCRAVTGNSVERRRLYTDSDQVLYTFRRAIMINGVDVPTSRPDFLDRCLIMTCQRVTEFKPLQELDAAFEQARPRLLGALLDLLSQVLAIYPETPPATEFRMADFARFGRAVARALERSEQQFDDAYRSNLDHQSRELIAESQWAQAIKILARKYDEQGPWRGSIQELLTRTQEDAKQNGIDIHHKSWPGSPRWASSQLAELSPALSSVGVHAVQGKREKDCRPWIIWSTQNAEEAQ